MDLVGFVNNNTQILAIWGAITGTLGSMIGVLSFIIKYKVYNKDKALLKIITNLGFTFNRSGIKQKNSITVVSVGKKTVFVESIQYFLRIENICRRFISFFYYNKGLYLHEYTFESIIEIQEGKNHKIDITLPKGLQLSDIKKIRIIDQTGKLWKVPWFTRNTITKKTKIVTIDNLELKRGDREISLKSSLVGCCYFLKYTFSGNHSMSINSRRFINRKQLDSYVKELKIKIEQFLDNEIDKI